MLIFNVLGVSPGVLQVAPEANRRRPKVVHELFEAYQSISRKNVIGPTTTRCRRRKRRSRCSASARLNRPEDARPLRAPVLGAAAKILRVVREMDYVPEELEGLERAMADTYYGNFSVFQSAPDHWAVKNVSRSC